MRFNCLKISRAPRTALRSVVQIVDSRRLGKITATSIAEDEEQVDQEGDCCDDTNRSGGADQVHTRCVRWPVVALLRVAPIL